MHELIELWRRTLGNPPAEQLFALWTESHPADIVRTAIIKTAAKNLSASSPMSQDHRIRFASKVMNTLSAARTHQHRWPAPKSGAALPV